MAWPLTAPVAPTLDTGPGVAVPTSSTSITTNPAWLLGAHFINTSASNRTITIRNTADAVLAQLTLPPGAEQPYEWPFRPSAGVKWQADGTGVLGHVWGYV